MFGINGSPLVIVVSPRSAMPGDRESWLHFYIILKNDILPAKAAVRANEEN